jgi:hypothetical protein
MFVVDTLCSFAVCLQRTVATTCPCSCNGGSDGLLGSRAISAKFDRYSNHYSKNNSLNVQWKKKCTPILFLEQ